METPHLRHERDTHAHEAKLGCEKGGSNKETEVSWQEGCENEKAEGSRRRCVVHDGKVGFDVAASSCRPDKGKIGNGLGVLRVLGYPQSCRYEDGELL